jgi:hypothetical protein
MKSNKMNDLLGRIMAFVSLLLVEMLILLQIFAVISTKKWSNTQLAKKEYGSKVEKRENNKLGVIRNYRNRYSVGDLICGIAIAVLPMIVITILALALR